MNKRYFKDVIKAYRINKNLTQRELAKILEIPYQALQKYEYGHVEPSLPFFIKLKKYDPTIDFNNLLDVDLLPKQNQNKK